jgi:hypothetical protein
MDEQAKQEQVDFEAKRTGASSAATSAQQAATSRLNERLENPEFFAQLRDLDIDTEQFEQLEAKLGPLGSGAHLIANRSEEYEREIKWLDRNRAERMLAERQSGRLCNGKTLEIAQKVHDKEGKEVREDYGSHERRAVRDAMEAVTNFKTLGIETAGLSSVTEATAVSRVEQSEEETSKSRLERAGDMI